MLVDAVIVSLIALMVGIVGFTRIAISVAWLVKTLLIALLLFVATTFMLCRLIRRDENT